MFDARDPAGKHSAPYPRLLGDIGGTNARFGWQASVDADITQVQVLPCAEHPSLFAALQSYLTQQGLDVPPSAAFGIATPITGDWIRMTNHPWQFSVNALRAELRIKRLLVLNDFTALALALPTLPPEHRRAVGSGNAAPGAAIGLIGAGTGLGVSGLLPLGGGKQWLPIAGEGGHVTLAASNALEFALIENLQKRYGHVSAERVLCGAGLVDLYHALCQVQGQAAREISNAAQVLEVALARSSSSAHLGADAPAPANPDPTAVEVLDLFCAFLGSVSGDLALTLGARGGVYIGGGIVPRLGQRFDASPFRSRFEAKGRYQNYLAQIPTWVIDSPVSPALHGAARALSLDA